MPTSRRQTTGASGHYLDSTLYLGYNQLVNKEQLARKLAKRLGKKCSDTKVLVDAFCQTIEETLVAEENILLSGFGTFSVTKFKPSETRSVHGHRMVVDNAVAVNFRAGRNLKKALNNRV